MPADHESSCGGYVSRRGVFFGAAAAILSIFHALSPKTIRRASGVSSAGKLSTTHAAPRIVRLTYTFDERGRVIKMVSEYDRPGDIVAYHYDV